jgi:hypothetical protein
MQTTFQSCNVNWHDYVLPTKQITSCFGLQSPACSHSQMKAFKLVYYSLKSSDKNIYNNIFSHTHTKKERQNFYDIHAISDRHNPNGHNFVVYYIFLIAYLSLWLSFINPWLKLTTKIETCCTVLSINKVCKKFFLLTYFI